MICDQYKNALIELAAAGAEPGQELRSHLQACSACRSAFENERSLFASIDSALRSSANTEVPSSFIPSVRARVQHESSAAPAMAPVSDRLLWVSGLAVAATILFTFSLINHRVKSSPTEEPFVTQQPRSPLIPQTTPTSHDLSSHPAPGKSLASKPVIAQLKHSTQIHTAEPEILVPPDQEILLARYANQWSRQHHSPALVTENASDQTDPPQVELIQIALLDVKPLAPDRENDPRIDQVYKQDQSHSQN
jgi:hypothetical protein